MAVRQCGAADCGVLTHSLQCAVRSALLSAVSSIARVMPECARKSAFASSDIFLNHDAIIFPWLGTGSKGKDGRKEGKDGRKEGKGGRKEGKEE